MTAQNYRDNLTVKLQDSLERFIDRVGEMAQTPPLDTALQVSPESLTLGRDFTQIVMDDAMSAIETIGAFVTGNDGSLEDSSLPLAVYQKLAERRVGQAISPQDALAKLKAGIEKKQGDISEAISEIPDFMKVLVNARSVDIQTPGDHDPKRFQPLIGKMDSQWQGFLTNTTYFYKTEEQLAAENVNAMAIGALHHHMKNIQLKPVFFPESNLTPEEAESANSLWADLAQQTQEEVQKNQQVYFLMERQKLVRKEDKRITQVLKKLGKEAEAEDAEESMAERIEKAGLPPEALKKAKKEVARLEKAQGAEANVIETWLDRVLEMPWNNRTTLDNNIVHTQEKLDADHYGLEKVKETIVKHVAVQNHTGQNSKTILCLVGPPGVGKTSIGRSIAEATGRKYVRMAAGGMSDEAEIRGHRSTYIGAMPGQIAELLKRAGTRNPLFLIDEIDKLQTSGMHGDPKAALLEVLDPEQNNSFKDRYLDLPFDLSEVMFVCTANYIEQIPPALKDRMHIVSLTGYTHEEKMQIAKRHLIPKQMKENGLTDEQFAITDNALEKLIHTHTREAGVRNLEREISGLCQEKVVLIEKGDKEKLTITEENLDDFAGPGHGASDRISKENQVGVVNGLYWSETGGGILPIEAELQPGKEFNFRVSGNLKDVMRESLDNAHAVVRSLASRFNDAAAAKKVEETAVHVNTPGQAIPKDGPSAGTALATALVSAVTGIPIHSSVAMTGELTLKGNVLPIGGLKEKLDGARREGFQTVLIPAGNEKDLIDVPKAIRESMAIIPVGTLDEVLTYALDTSKLDESRRNKPVLKNQKNWTPL